MANKSISRNKLNKTKLKASKNSSYSISDSYSSDYDYISSLYSDS